MSKTKTLWDWSGSHTPVWAAVSATGTALSTTVIADLAGVHPAWALAASTAGAGVTLISKLRNRLTTATTTVRSGLWLAFGGWSSHAIASNPWSVDNLAALTVGGIAAYGLTHATAARDAREAQEQAEQLLLQERKNADDIWADRIKRVCRIEGVRILGNKTWELGNGYTLEVQMPPGGSTYRDIERSQVALAADLHLGPGCGVEAREGANRSLTLIDVTTTDVFADSVPFGDDYSPLSINDPFPIGLFRNGSPAQLYLREDSVMVIGQRRSGKTNQLNVLIAQFARMTDCLIWVIDFNSGNLALDWIRPWKEAHDTGRGDQVPNPVVDWVASTPDEALRMTAAGLRIAKARKTGYQTRKREHNVTLLPIAPDVPEIFIIIDECAEMLGQDAMTKNMRGTPLRDAAENFAEIQRIAGDSGVNVAICGLRSTADVISDTGLKAGARAKIHMRSDKAAEYGFTFENYHLDPADVPVKGNGFMRTGTETPRPFKGFEMFPRQMEQIATATAALQPALDNLSLKAAGDDYQTRWDWDRYGHLFAGAPVTATAATADTDTPPARRSDRPDPTTDWSRQAPANWEQLEAERRRTHEDRMRHLDEQLGKDTDVEAEFRRLTRSIEQDMQTAGDDPTDPRTWTNPNAIPDDDTDTGPARARMLTLLQEAGRDGLTALQLQEALGVSKKTVYAHLGHHQGQDTVGKLNTKPVRYALKSFYADGDPA